MSNRRTRARDAHRAARFAAHLAGCTCSFDITTRHVDGAPHVTVLHDEWCPARNAPTSVAILTTSGDQKHP